MSKEIRNTYREAFMRNYTTYTIDRYVRIDKKHKKEEQKDKIVKKINELLWLETQKINSLVKGRILPFVNARRVVDWGNNKLRVLIDDEDECFYTFLNPEEYSHIVGITDKYGIQRRIMFGEFQINYNARVLAADSEEIFAAVDIFLDIAMFHSYSFLSTLSIVEKQLFNEKKMRFFMQRKDESYYLLDKTNPPTYVSIAFLARELNGRINTEKYIDLWNQFIKEFYPQNKNSISSASKQMLNHIDSGNIPKEYFTDIFWQKVPKGDYLLLRINRDPDDMERRRRLCEYFGIESFHIGAIKLAPIESYYVPAVKRDMKELVVSGFKVVNI